MVNKITGPGYRICPEDIVSIPEELSSKIPKHLFRDQNTWSDLNVHQALTCGDGSGCVCVGAGGGLGVGGWGWDGVGGVCPHGLKSVDS